MYSIYLVFTLLFLWASVAGVTLVANRYLEDVAVARTTGLLSVVLVMFFIEHFVGLGKLHWLMPVAVGVGAWLLWQNRPAKNNQEFWRAEMVFALAFVYGLFWRWSYPSISPSSEKLTDLFFISNYYPGFTLPPPDNWYPPHLFDYYYAFQHYAAALMGRVFNLEIGVCYNLAFALIAALPLALAWSVSGYFIKKLWLRILLVSTLALGGTGITPILHLVLQSPDTPSTRDKNAWVQYGQAVEGYSRENIIGSVRFIGGSMDRSLKDNPQVNQTAARLLLPDDSRRGNKPSMVLPAENFGYQFFLGDYHPSSGGFLLLLLALALMLCVEGNRQPRVCQALLALTVPVMLITNTWVLPLLVLLILGWMAHRWLDRRPLDWAWLIGGGVLGTFLIYPFLVGFTASSLATPVKFVSADQHTPLSRFLAMHWPFLLVLVFALFEPRHRRLALTMSGIWLFLLLLSEFIYIDDPTARQYERTNTTMKWWGWIHTGVVAFMGALCLGSSRRWIRWATVAVFLVINIVALDLARYWFCSGRHYQGQLAGHQWYTREAANRQMFEYLAAAPRGVVLESLPDNAYVNTSIYAIFNGKPVLLGWPSHLLTWHGDVPRVWLLKEEIDRFYRGDMEDPAPWLLSHRVDYVVFGPKDDNSKFDTINSRMAPDYVWHEFNHSRRRHMGIWVRKSL